MLRPYPIKEELAIVSAACAVLALIDPDLTPGDLTALLRSRRAPQGEAQPDRLLTVKVVADRLSLSQRSVCRLSIAGILPHVKIGRSVRFRESDVVKFLQGRTRRGAGAGVNMQ